MDPVMIGAVLLAIATGAGEGLGKQLWDGMVSLVRRPFHHKAGNGGAAAAPAQPTGEAELVALQQAPGDQHKALALAEVLLARSSADYQFRQALESWWQQAEPIRSGISTGNVANTVSGGTQQGPVLQGRDFSNVTFGVASATPPLVPPSLERGAEMADPGGDVACNGISGGTQQGPVLQGRDFRDVYVGAAAAPVALAQLPANVAGFADRDIELTTITRLLDPGPPADAVVVSAMGGLAGVGKTALAVAAGHKVRECGWFGGGVLFVDLHGYDEHPVQPGQALDALLRALGVEGKHIPHGTEQRAGLYRSKLAGISEPVLVIADNVASEEQVRPLLPGAGPHRVMVTSRHTLAGLGARLLDVTVLDEAASVTLLDLALRAARPEDERISTDRHAAVRLACICGGLPLALQIVAALLKADPSCRVSDLAEDLAAERDRLEWLRLGNGVGIPSVVAAFELSYQRLDETSARVFRLLPLNPGPDVSTAAVAVLAGLPQRRARQALADLAMAHLVERAPVSPRRWRMHSLLRLYAQRLGDEKANADDRERAQDRLLNFYVEMADAADQHVWALPGTQVPGRFEDQADALAWLDAERPSMVAAVSMAAATGRDQIAMRLPVHLADYFHWRRRFDDQLATSCISRDVARRLGDQTHEAMALTSFGVALRGMRQFAEAITAHKAAIAICRETGDRHGEGRALNNLGAALREARQFADAITASQAAVAICQETGDRHGEGRALNYLGATLREAQKFTEAISASQAAAAICQETGYRHGEARAQGNLGVALRNAGRIAEAISASQAAVVIFRETGDRHGEGRALNDLSLALRDSGRFAEAITASQAAVAICQETGDRHGKGRSLNSLGLALRRMRRFEEAITAYQDALVIFRETGDRHGEGRTLNNLGVAVRGMRRFEEAIAAHQDALAIFRETGDQHREGKALNYLGLALRGMRRSEEAITAHRDALAIFRETGGRQDEGRALNGLGQALREVQQMEEAITAHRDALTIFRETGDRHREGRALNYLCLALREIRQMEEAITAVQDALAIFRETGDRHNQGRALNSLGLALRDAGLVTEAIAAHQDALAIFRETGDRRREDEALNNLELDQAA